MMNTESRKMDTSDGKKAVTENKGDRESRNFTKEQRKAKHVETLN